MASTPPWAKGLKEVCTFANNEKAITSANFFYSGCVIDVAISPGGRYFATAELDLVQIWNLPTRVVLFRDSQEDLVQLERVECPPGPGLVVAFSCNQFSDREDESDGKRNVTCRQFP